jgi:hypothetical protein
VPADPTARPSAIGPGSAYLGGKSTAELKRRERQTWVVIAILVAVAIAGAVLESSVYARLYFLTLGLLVAIALPIAMGRGRRIQRNLALLTDTGDS